MRMRGRHAGATGANADTGGYPGPAAVDDPAVTYGPPTDGSVGSDAAEPGVILVAVEAPDAATAETLSADEAATVEMAGAGLLDHPVEGDLQPQLEALAPRRIGNRLTLVLAAAALLAAGFVAGAQMQQRYGTAAGTTAAGTRGFGGNAGYPGGYPGGGFASGGARQGAGAGNGPAAGNGSTQGNGPTRGNGAAPDDGAAAGGAGTGGGTTTGKVKLVDGTTVYLETADGQIITIKTTPTTTVQTTQPGSLRDLAAGSTLTVEGTTSGTTITATMLTRTP